MVKANKFEINFIFSDSKWKKKRVFECSKWGVRLVFFITEQREKVEDIRSGDQEKINKRKWK